MSSSNKTKSVAATTGVEWLVFIVFFSLFTGLGIWQIDRADQKRDIQNQINARSEQAAFDLNQNLDQLPKNEDLQYRKLRVRGKFTNNNQLLIDNIRLKQNIGYNVITPFKIEGSDKSILVNRGWVAQGISRQTLPIVSIPQGTIELEGIMRTPSALPFVDSNIEPLSNSDAFNVWLYIDIEKYQKESGINLLSFALYQQNKLDDGLHRDWPAYKAKIMMHIGYAIQWLAFSVIVTVILLWQRRSRTHKPKTQQ